jgi:hypothetical protein
MARTYGNVEWLVHGPAFVCADTTTWSVQQQDKIRELETMCACY